MGHGFPYHAGRVNQIAPVLVSWGVLLLVGCTTVDGTIRRLSHEQEQFIKEAKTLLVEIERVRLIPASTTLPARQVSPVAQPIPVSQAGLPREAVQSERDLGAIHLSLMQQSRSLEQLRQDLLAQWLALADREGVPAANMVTRTGEWRPVLATRKGFYAMVTAFLNRYRLDESGLLRFESP